MEIITEINIIMKRDELIQFALEAFYFASGYIMSIADISAERREEVGKWVDEYIKKHEN